MAVVKRPPPKNRLPDIYWSDMPKLDLGPGHDLVYNRERAAAKAERDRFSQFTANFR